MDRQLLNFETLLSDISTEFINLISHEIDSGITQALERLGQFMEVDRVYIMLFSDDDEYISETHTWFKEGIKNTLPSYQAIPVSHFPWFLGQIREGKPVVVNNGAALPPEGLTELKPLMDKDHTRAFVGVPLSVMEEVLGFVAFDDCQGMREWSETLVKRLKLVGEIFANALSRKRSEEALAKSYKEIQELKDQLELENEYLKEEIKSNKNFENIIGWSGALKKTAQLIEQVAPTEATVLILGETGTGKELMARAIHNLSQRKGKSLVKVNCAALPAYLIESELFGHEKGAFTGAISKQIGRFELADGGTIFLDEIGEMPIEAQVKLLRVLQEGEFERVGNPKTIKVDVRVIAATNRDLEDEIKNNRFRSDLYYRLNIFPINIPPLRERKEDIPFFVRAFCSHFGKKIGKSIEHIPTKVIHELQAYSFPGNVRELENIIERAVIISQRNKLELLDFHLGNAQKAESPQLSGTLAEVEQNYITQVLNACNWKVEGDAGASQVLGLNPSTLRSRMNKLGIKKPELKA